MNIIAQNPYKNNQLRLSEKKIIGNAYKKCKENNLIYARKLKTIFLDSKENM